MGDEIFEKVCIKCKGAPQPLDSFDKNKASKDGRTGVCKACRSKRRREQYAVNPEPFNRSSKAYYEANRTRMNAINRENERKKIEQYRATKRRWKKNNPEKVRQGIIRRQARIRIQVLLALGGYCECCGEQELKFLTFDHKAGDGAAHRRALGGSQNASSFTLANWIRRNMEEAKRILRVYCYNCNNASWKNGGTCPHQEARLAIAA